MCEFIIIIIGICTIGTYFSISFPENTCKSIFKDYDYDILLKNEFLVFLIASASSELNPRFKPFANVART